MNDKKEEILAFFFADVNEQIEYLEQDILKLESNSDDSEIIQNIFRYAHSIKGSSASMGFDVLKDVTHNMEYVLDLIRKNKLNVNDEVIDILFECLDVLKSLKDSYQNNSELMDVNDIILKLKKLYSNDYNDKSTSNNKPSSFSFSFTLSDKVLESLNNGTEVYCLQVLFTSKCLNKTIKTQIVKKEVIKLGEIVDLDLSNCENNDIRTSYFYLTNINENENETIINRIKKVMDVENCILNKLDKLQENKQAKNEAVQPKKIVKKQANSTLRVDVNKIENLMNLVGEIIIDQTMLSSLNTLLKNENKSNEHITEQDKILKHMARVVSEFQENVMKIRMLPIEQLFSKYPRVVRDLSKDLGKEIELIIEGAETELDRNVIEELADPLTHIIRNSIDHGIEKPDDREKTGKNRKGKIILSATHKENQILLIIEDDGAGINPENIKESAIKKGIITHEKANIMSENELVNLIFAAGFSTAKVVSDVSGRGVGMDVVRNNIEKLNGTVEVVTKHGFGTKMIIKLPLTLAILKAFLIDINGHTFAIPMNSVIEIFKINKNEIQLVNGEKMVKLRDLSIPIIKGTEIFDKDTKDIETDTSVIMLVGIAEKRMGVVVDRLIGNQEIVIKSLGSFVGKLPAISGSTILGDGKVALILDVAGIFKLISDRKKETN